MGIVLTKRWIEGKLENGLVEALCAELRISRPTAMVLANRGVGLENARSFLNPKLSDLSDPYLMNGIETAVKAYADDVRDRSFPTEDQVYR